MACRTIVALLIAAMAGGCTSRDLYHAGQEYQRQECRSGPVSDYEECLRRADLSYERYREIKEAVEREHQGHEVPVSGT